MLIRNRTTDSLWYYSSLYVAWLIYYGSVELMSHVRCRYTFLFVQTELKKMLLHILFKVPRKGLWSQALCNVSVVMNGWLGWIFHMWSFCHKPKNLSLAMHVSEQQLIDDICGLFICGLSSLQTSIWWEWL